MKKLLVAVFLLAAAPAFAEPFEDGIRALQARDFAGARAVFGPLAAEGSGPAQFMLGVMHEKGFGMTKDMDAAAAWYLKAAKAGVASAQYNIGVFHQLGKGVAKDPAEALRWHGAAAAQGHNRAQNNLGTMYYTGSGVARDPVEAWKWLTLSARGLRGEARDIVNENIAAIEGELAPAALAEAKRRAAAWKPRK